MASKPTPPAAAPALSKTLSALLLRLPRTEESTASDPRSRSRLLARSAARKAAAISAGLALPPGPVGMLTILPDLAAIWKLQSRLVADIAGTYGQSASLTRESLVYCLFKHGAAALLRDVVVRTGQRYLVKRTTLRVLERLLAQIGVRLTHQALGRTVARYVPLLGAAAVGAYAYYDTAKVAANAIELFATEVAVEAEVGAARGKGRA